MGNLFASYELERINEELKAEIVKLKEQVEVKDIQIKHLQEQVKKLTQMLNHKNSVDEPETMRGYNKRISREKEEVILKKYKVYNNISYVAKEVGVARNTVYSVLRRNGIQI